MEFFVEFSTYSLVTLRRVCLAIEGWYQNTIYYDQIPLYHNNVSPPYIFLFSEISEFFSTETIQTILLFTKFFLLFDEKSVLYFCHSV